MRYLITILLSLIFSLPVHAQSVVYLTGMRLAPALTKTTITFDLSDNTTGVVKFIPADNHLQLTFANTKLRFNVHKAKLRNANIMEFTARETRHNTVEFTFTTNGKVTWTTVIRTNPQTQHTEMQLEVLSKTTLPVKETKLEKSELIGRARWEDQKATIAQRKTQLFTVVIDAGHGGKDTGAVSKNGLREKDIVLSIAKKVADKLKQLPGVRVLMTRKGDYYVPLRTRLDIARKDTADLFIAIHADAYFADNAIGASVYALSQHGATNEASRWLARQENYSEIDGIDFERLPDRSRMLRSVLIDLSQTATIRDSLHLGNKVLDALDNITSLHYRHVEQAPFMVLKSPDIPSILIETGFISNPREAKQLATPAYQNKLADAVCNGVKAYMAKFATL